MHHPGFSAVLWMADQGVCLEKLTIKARTAESAQRLDAALTEFRPAMVESEDGWRVEVELGPGDREIVDVLNAIERYITERQSGPAQIELHGRDYTMHPAEGFGAPGPAA